MSYKRIIESDVAALAQPTEAYTGDAISMYLGKNLSCQVVSVVQANTGKTFDSPKKAVLTDQDITYTAVDAGAAGNDITIELIDPGVDGSLDIAVTDLAIVVTLAYATGSVTTDADALVAALNLDVDVSALIVASGTGNTPLTDLAETPLATGTDGEVDLETFELSIPSHGFIQGAVVRLTSTGTLPDPLATGTDYFVIRIDANTIQLAADADDAEALIPIELVDAGSNGAVNTVTPTAISGLSVTLQKSNDGVNWTDVDSANITVSGSVYIGDDVDVINFKYLRFVKAISAGSAEIEANLLVIGDAI